MKIFRRTPLNNRIYMRWSLWQRFLALACIIVFFPLTIGILVTLSLIPVYLSNHAIDITRSNTAPPFNVTYLLVDPTIQSTNELNLNSVDRIKMARSFEYGLKLNTRNVLEINNIIPDIAIGQNLNSRRKRFVQCSGDSSGMSGPVLTFDFNRMYPTDRSCQNQNCVSKTFDTIYKQFQSVLTLFVDFNNVLRELRLCSVDASSFSALANPSTEPETSSVSNILTTSSSTITTSSNQESVMSTSISTTESIESTSIFTTQFISTEESITTNTPNMNTITEIENSTLVSNETMIDSDLCLKKLPFIQEQVPPYRITHTSTLFFQDNQSLVVVGASKFDTIIDMQTIKKQIKINGEIVYKNCQRTIETSIPVVCSSS